MAQKYYSIFKRIKLRITLNKIIIFFVIILAFILIFLGSYGISEQTARLSIKTEESEDYPTNYKELKSKLDKSYKYDKNVGSFYKVSGELEESSDNYLISDNYEVIIKTSPVVSENTIDLLTLFKQEKEKLSLGNRKVVLYDLGTKIYQEEETDKKSIIEISQVILNNKERLNVLFDHFLINRRGVLIGLFSKEDPESYKEIVLDTVRSFKPVTFTGDLNDIKLKNLSLGNLELKLPTSFEIKENAYGFSLSPPVCERNPFDNSYLFILKTNTSPFGIKDEIYYNPKIFNNLTKCQWDNVSCTVLKEEKDLKRIGQVEDLNIILEKKDKRLKLKGIHYTYTTGENIIHILGIGEENVSYEAVENLTKEVVRENESNLSRL